MIWFNEIDPTACAVLRHCYPGAVVIERSIKDLTPDDVAGPGRRHFFAGAGLWEAAARLAGWPDECDLWSASCPCQPFSVAGKGLGTDDPRHLWPDLFRIVRAVRPARIVGEQVSGAAGYGWFDGVRADLEAEGYACRAVDIPACAVDAPHQRNRLYWIALGDASNERRQRAGVAWDRKREPSHSDEPMADAEHFRWSNADVRGSVDATQTKRRIESTTEFGKRDQTSGVQPLVYAERVGLEGLDRDGDVVGRPGRLGPYAAGSAAAPDGSFWSGAEWIGCADGKSRRAKPGLRLLVDGLVGRADLWRLAGNSIVAPIAAEVLKALLETI